MAFGVNHVACAPSRGENRGRAHFANPPYIPTTTPPNRRSATGFDVGRHRTVKDRESDPETGSPGLVREGPGVDDHARRRTQSIKGRVMRNRKRSQLL